jgi:hypothetical protein
MAHSNPLMDVSPSARLVWLAALDEFRNWPALALNTLVCCVSGTIVGTAPYATGVAADAQDRLSMATSHPTASDRIVEPRRKNGCVEKFEDCARREGRVSIAC